ncbi:MAG: hypothetical protein J5I93_13045, partial [Pirellulaceae bacterium]|nr:hypothetical protein [Pirellulaceae bacterium]
ERRTVFVILGACAGIAVLLISAVVIGIGVWFSTTRNSSDPAAAIAETAVEVATVRGDFSNLDIPSKPVVLDSIGEGPSVAPSAPPASLFSPADPFDEAQAARELAAGDASSTSAGTESAGTESAGKEQSLPKPPSTQGGTAWQAGIDAVANVPRAQFAPDLRIEFWPLKNDPILADGNGPFALVPSVYQGQPFRAEKREVDDGTGKRTEYALIETPQAAVPVIDLRTGERAGEFDWRVPFWSSPALSPDGRYLLGPFHVPVRKFSRAVQETYAEPLAALYLWVRDSSDPPRQLKMPGAVSWFGFAGSDTAVVLVETPERQLQLWDVATGTQRSAVKLPMDWRSTSDEADDRFPMQRTWRDPLGAVSPGGRYVAVAGGKSIAMVSIEEARILGTQALELRGQDEEDLLGLSFSDAGDKLLVAHVPPHDDRLWTRILVFDAASGRRLQSLDHPGRAYGPAVLDQAGTTCIHGGNVGIYRGSAWLIDFERQRAGILRSLQQVVRWPAAGPALVIQATPGESQQTLLAMDRAAFQHQLAEVRGDPIPDIEFAAEPQIVVRITPPAQWRPIPPITAMAPGNHDVLPGPPWLTSCSDQYLSVLDENPVEVDSERGVKRFQVKVAVRQIDRASGVPVRPPVILREWTEESKGWLGNKVRVFGMSPDGQRFVTRHPHAPDRVELWTMLGEPLFSFSPFQSATEVEWAEFAGEDVLLIAGGGEITAWRVGNKSCHSLYATSEGGYMLPYRLTPDRKLLLASRGHSVDFLDVQTGECLNRAGVNTGRKRICDLALSPDTQSLAAMYAPPAAAEQLLRDQRVSATGNAAIPVTIAVWNLGTGDALHFNSLGNVFAFIAWIGNEHLCLASRDSQVIDLRLRLATLLYENGSDQYVGAKLGKSSDGRIWRFFDRKLLVNEDNLKDWASLESPDDYPRRVLIWRAPTLTGERTDEERPFFADDREAINLVDSPFQIALDLGDERRARLKGKRILEELQGRGFAIGPGGCVFSIQPRVTSAGDNVLVGGKPAAVPQVEYSWKIQDPQGRTVWTASSVGRFSFTQSKYVTSSGGGMVTYDFGRTPMREAVVQEILAKGDGLEVVPEVPRQLLYSGKDYLTFPARLPWRFSADEPAGG